MAKLIQGIGYNSGGDYKVSESGKLTKPYRVWHAMLLRCYSPAQQLKQPTYIGCSVENHWHDFQNFADWYCKHKHADKGYHLDKDLLVANNKIYSRQTCVLIPSEINNLLTNSRSSRGKYPQGVHYDERNKKYRALLSVNSKLIHLGLFDSVEGAYNAYKKSKEACVKDKALEWKERITKDAFDALMRWSLVCQ